MATLKEIIEKVNSGTATAKDFELLATLSKEQATEKKAVETAAQDIIKKIKDAKIDPQILTNLLVTEELIILPKVAKKEEKVIIFETPITTKAGRSSSFKVWKGRDLNTLAGDTRNYWNEIKRNGKQYFINNLNEEGKKYYETEEGKKYIDSIIF
ncbi:MAG TPA: hypothetical protein GXX62_04790 [Alcaligenaceae bacterium]|nr:hypothetical protein [Alcaligenaceae bacterium]